MRWIRLDIGWSESAWLTVLSAEARLAWIELLCYVKASGAAGRAKALVPERFARRIYVGEEAVRQMLMAAENHGALAIVEGDWLIVKWREFQGDDTAPERMKRYRENQKAREVTPVTRNVTPVTDVTTTETETLTETEVVDIENKGGVGGDTPPSEVSCGAKAPWPSRLFDSLPSHLQTEAVRSAIGRYAVHRRERKLPAYQNSGLIALGQKLSGWDEATVIRAVDDCIANNWQGLFEPKAPPASKVPASIRETDGDLTRQILARSVKQ